MTGVNRHFLSEQDFRELERILSGGKVTPRLRSKVRALVRDYVALRRISEFEKGLDLAPARKIDAAARALHREITKLDKSARRNLARSLDAVRDELYLASGRMSPRAEPLDHAALLEQLAAQCAALGNGGISFRVRKRRKGARANEAHRVLFYDLRKIYRQYKGEDPKVEMCEGDEYGEGGAVFTGDFLAVAAIVERVAAVAAGEKPKSNAALGKWITRWNENLRLDPALPDEAFLENLSEAFAEILSDDGRLKRRKRKARRSGPRPPVRT
jgi:hypothetical protein